jgi:hypothetical protein
MRLRGPGAIQPSLPAAEVDEIVGKEFGSRLQPRQFEQVARRTWVRSAKAPIREGVGLTAIKGYSFVPVWSISLDVVPHVTSTGRVEWHRTAKRHVVDLGVDPLDQPDRVDVDALVIRGMRTARQFQRAAGRSAELVVGLAEAWFARINDVASLLPLYEEAQHAPVVRFGFDNHLQWQLSYAFVLAHVGSIDSARSALDNWCARSLDRLSGVTDDRRSAIRRQLHELLETAGRRGC